jgi:DHA2 family multidrug resistance protein
VFLINLPVGIIAFLGVLFFVQETERRERPFDAFGFLMLSLAIGAFQLMLDRGEIEDWFESNEIVLYATVSAVTFYVFLVHMFTTDRPFLEPAVFKDRNVLVGLCFIFVFGVVLLATMVLLPPMLQNLLDFPVVTTGLVLAPRGIGSGIAMMLVGRLITRIDPRLMVLFGLICVAAALEDAAHWSTDISVGHVVRNGLLQGVGLGFLFVPLSTLTFATLEARYRTEAAGMFALMRNIGSSIGVSIVITLLSQNTQRYHAILSEHVSPFNWLYAPELLPPMWNWTDPRGLMALNAEVTNQASMIAYLHDFRFMALMTLAAIPLVALLRRPKTPPSEPVHAAAD